MKFSVQFGLLFAVTIVFIILMVVLSNYSKVAMGVTTGVIGAVLLGGLIYTGYNWYNAYNNYKNMIKKAHDTVISSVVNKNNEDLNKNCADFMKLKSEIEHDPKLLNMFNEFVGTLDSISSKKKEERQYQINNLCNNAASVALYLKNLNSAFDPSKPYTSYIKSPLEI